ncbi:MAG: disulfide bond formation protein B [Rhodocyclaceae bacterium]|nr:disulfide bond formation protein B [Rhodocyclaceae bacterium]
MNAYQKTAGLSPRTCYALVMLGAALAMTAALIMQFGRGLQPCTMCIIQRYAFVIVGFCAFFAWTLPFRLIRVVLVVLGIAGALVGIGAAIRNLWVMAHPEVLCGRDPVELFLNGLPTAQWMPEVFVASGLCSAPIPPLLGLSLPAWSLIGLFILAVLLGLSLRKR